MTQTMKKSVKELGPKPVFPNIVIQKEKHPEPMSLMHKREKDLPPLPYRKPEVTQGAAEKAAGAMADWDNSDPFSYGRTMLYVKQGYIDPRDTIKDMSKRTLERRLAKVREIEDAKFR